MEIYPDCKYSERFVENNGFINSHLCLDAQTSVEYTEPDSLYTLIIVPKQSKRAKDSGTKNARKFELIINESKTIIIHMSIGTIFTYSAYMLTHQQQIKYE